MQSKKELVDVNVETMDEGSVIDALNREIDRVIQNIADPETSTKDKREVVCKLKFSVNEQRDIVVIVSEVTSKLAGPRASAATIALGVDSQGRVEASEIVSRQVKMDFDNVESIEHARTRGDNGDQESN